MFNIKESIDHSSLQFETETGRAFGTSKFDQYLQRGDELKYLNFYCWCGIIGIQKKTKTSNNMETSSKGGRPLNRKFAFSHDSQSDKGLEQIIMSCPCIPRISGRAPPSYPGNKPTTDKERKIWAIDAKLFVEFYSLLFLPINEHLIPFDPTNDTVKILPWNETTSWKNFWIIFGSWNVKEYESDTDQFFKRSMWRIFKNMVDNLRLTQLERDLATSWRFHWADTRSEVNSNNKHGSDKRFSSSYMDYNDIVMEDDIAVIAESIRAKHGADSFKSKSEKELNKANAYLKQQINTLKKLT